jgi:hypothetical protein
MQANEVGEHRGVLAWALALCLLLLMAIPASAQEAGTILGVVKDASGGVVPNAKVTTTNVDTSDVRTVTTTADGSYRVPGLQPGRYSLKVEAQGFQTQTQTGLTLNVAQQLVVNSTLQVGAATQEVTVTGEAPVINTTTSSVGGLVNDQQISELPLNGRNYTDLTLLQPGIAKTTHSGLGDSGLWYSSNGAPPRSNNYTIDGALMNSKNGTGPAGVTGYTLGVSGIKEYRVVTNAFSADYGLLMGSQTVIVSKSGTNSWHGDVFEYLRNNHLDARNFFDPNPSLIPGSYNRLPQFKRNNFGGSVGGPIQKDKTFFYLTYEGVRLQQGDTIQDVTMPTACHVVSNNGNTIIIGGGPISASDLAKLQTAYPGITQKILQAPLSGTTTLANVNGLGLDSNNCLGQGAGVAVAPLVQPWIGQFPLPNEAASAANPLNYTFPGFTHARDDFAQLRVDHNFSSNDTFFARYTIDDGFITTPYLGGNLSAADTGTAYPQYSPFARSRNQYATLGENHIFSANVLNTIRVSFSRIPYSNDFTQANTPMNPDFFLQDGPNSPCVTTQAPGSCIWSFVPGFFTGGFNPGSGVTALTPPGTSPNYHINDVWTLSDDVFYTHGRHAFKFGTLVTLNMQPHLQSKSIFGAVTFGNIGNFLAGTPANYNVVLPGQSVALNPGVAGATLLAPPFDGNYLDRSFTWKTYGFYVQDDFRATPRLTLNMGVRYEFRSDLSEIFGRQSTIPDIHTSSNYALVPSVYRNPSYKDISPRVGFAWDVRGNGRTAVRGGFGVYYDVANLGALLTQNSTGVPPFLSNTTFQNTTNQPLVLPLIPSTPGRSLQLGDYNQKSPHSLEYNLSVEQQLPGGLGLSVSYVGRRGLNLFTGAEGNPVVPENLDAVLNGAVPTYNVANGQAGCLNNTIPVSDSGVVGAFPKPTTDPSYPCRVNPFWTSALFYTNAAASWYNGLQITVNKQLSRGLMVQSSYTYSRSTDDTQGTRFNDDCGGAPAAAFGRNPYDMAANYGPSCFDTTHVLHLSLLYHLPGVSSNGFLSKAVNGWWIGNIVSVQGGTPITPFVQNDRSFSGVITQNSLDYASLNTSSTPNLTSSPFIPYDPSTFITGNPLQWFNPLMLGVSQLGVPGNSPRGIIRNPGLGEWDFSLVKDTKLGFLGEGGNLQFRAEFFNMLNRANFDFLNNGLTVFSAKTTSATACPVGAVACDAFAPLSSAGQITQTATTARQIQFALRLSF